MADNAELYRAIGELSGKMDAAMQLFGRYHERTDELDKRVGKVEVAQAASAADKSARADITARAVSGLSLLIAAFPFLQKLGGK